MVSKRDLQRQIDKLREQIEGSFALESKYEAMSRDPAYYYYDFGDYRLQSIRKHKLTLAGKVDALIEHLGIDLQVEQKKTTGPTVKKVSMVKKNKK